MAKDEKKHKILQFSREDCPAPVSPSLAWFRLKRTPGYAPSLQISIPPEFFIFRLIRQASKPRTVQSLVYPNEVNEWYSCGKVVYFIEV